MDRVRQKHGPSVEKSPFAWRRLFDQLVGLAIVAAVGWYMWERRGTITQVLDISWRQLLLMAALVLATWVSTSVQSYLMFRAQGAQIGFLENLVVAVASTFGNYLPMRVGTLVRGHYMKQVHGITYVRYGSISGMRTVIMMGTTALLGLFGSVAVGITQASPSTPLIAFFSALLIFSSVAFFVRLPRAKGAGRIAVFWNDFVDGLATMRTQPGVALQVSVFVILQYVLTGWRMLISLSAMNVEASPFLAALLGPVAALGSLLAITPGGLGLREALVGYATLAVGMPFSTGLFAGAIDRAVLLCLVALVGSTCFGYVWFRTDRILPDRRAGADPATRRRSS